MSTTSDQSSANSNLTMDQTNRPSGWSRTRTKINNYLSRIYTKFSYYFSPRNFDRVTNLWFTKWAFYFIALFTLICTIYVDTIANDPNSFMLIAPSRILNLGEDTYPVDQELLQKYALQESVNFLFLFDESESMDPDIGLTGNVDDDRSNSRTKVLTTATEILEDWDSNDNIQTKDLGLPRLLTDVFINQLKDLHKIQDTTGSIRKFNLAVASFGEELKIQIPGNSEFTDLDEYENSRKSFCKKPKYGDQTDLLGAIENLKMEYDELKPNSKSKVVLTIISDFNDDVRLDELDYRDALEDLCMIEKLQINLVILPTYKKSRSDKVIGFFQDQFKMDRLGLYYIRDFNRFKDTEDHKNEKRKTWLKSILAPKILVTERPLRFKYEDQHFQKSESSIQIAESTNGKVMITLRSYQGKRPKTFITSLRPEGVSGIPHGSPSPLRENNSVFVEAEKDEVIKFNLEHYPKHNLPDLSLEVFSNNHPYKLQIPMEYIKQLPLWGAWSMFVFEIGSIFFLFITILHFFQIPALFSVTLSHAAIATERDWLENKSSELVKKTEAWAEQRGSNAIGKAENKNGRGKEKSNSRVSKRNRHKAGIQSSQSKKPRKDSDQSKGSPSPLLPKIE